MTSGATKRKRLAERRKAMGLTQEQLAQQLGVERTTVVRWERGETQPLPRLRPGLARALQVPAERIDELLTTSAAPISREAQSSALVPRQLPAAVAGFTGRAVELAALTSMLAGPGEPGTVVIGAIGGTAGVGKTALALHWAHQVAGDFQDGQLHVNLRGFDPSGAPVEPEVVIRGFLDALGVPRERIPADPQAQAGLYRSLLAERQMLIVLDNARDERQVRPLLPASPGSVVLITSRSQLGGLAAADGARLLALGLLSQADAVQLLRVRLGADRAAAESDAVGRIASLCGCLPLALAVAGARAAASPGLALSALADELNDSVGRLEALDAGEPATSVRAVFSWSIRQVSAEAERMFRLLGLHLGPDISVPAAASLAGTDGAEARRVLGELARAHLIAEHAPGRYAFHDLLRAYAAEQARRHSSEDDRDDAIGRALDHYLHTARAAVIALTKSEVSRDVIMAPLRPGVAIERLAGYDEALSWLEAELPVLIGAVTLAAESGFDSHAWQLPWAIAPFLEIRGHWQQWVPIQQLAVAAANRTGDAAAQAVSGRLLAGAFQRLGDTDQARSHYASSVTLYRRLGDRLGEAKIEQSLGGLAERHGQYTEALGHSEQALRLYRAVGDQVAEAGALNDVGWYHGLVGEYEQARTFCRQALALCVEAGSRFTEGHVWDSLGYAEYQLGNLTEALTCYQRALAIGREAGERRLEAEALNHLGDTRQAAGDRAQAREHWRQAADILDDIQHPSAERVRAKLASTTGHATANPSA
jgi:tetratricopeptide (TPR) repeat protein/transcriptional regulator with XRE-family HTH domain